MTRWSGTAFVTVLLTLSVALPADAQRRRGSDDSGSGRGFFMIGGQQLDLDELNDRLEDAGYPDMEDLVLTLGGGGFFQRGRLIIGGEGHGLVGSSETTEDGDLRTSLAGGYGLFNLGYAVVDEDGLLVYPFIGVGGGGIMLGIEERSTPTFDEVLDQPRRSVHLNQAQFLLSAALGVDKVFGSGRGGLAVGLRGGWTFAPMEGEWGFGRNDVAGGPDGGLTGPYVRLSIGGGRR